MAKLVIVEDDLMVAALNREFALRTPELKVIATFYNGQTALEFMLKNSADLLLLDIGLQESIDGLDLLSELRRHGNMVDVIIISGESEADKVEGAFHLGIVDYLIKPFTYERFHEALQKFFLRKSMLEKGKYTQADIDRLLATANESTRIYNVLRKGLQQATLDKIIECLTSKKNFGNFMTSDQISEETSLSKVTIRRYMSYLIEQRQVISRVNYLTGGRPSIEYALITD